MYIIKLPNKHDKGEAWIDYSAIIRMFTDFRYNQPR